MFHCSGYATGQRGERHDPVGGLGLAGADHVGSGSAARVPGGGGHACALSQREYACVEGFVPTASYAVGLLRTRVPLFSFRKLVISSCVCSGSSQLVPLSKHRLNSRCAVSFKLWYPMGIVEVFLAVLDSESWALVLLGGHR